MPLTAKAAHKGALGGFPLQHLSRLLLRVSYARHGMSPPGASVNRKSKGNSLPLIIVVSSICLAGRSGVNPAQAPYLFCRPPEGKAESRLPILLTNL